MNLNDDKPEDLPEDLFDAIDYEDMKAFKALIEQGADVNARAGDEEQTVLMYAIDNEFSKAVPALLAAGARIHEKDEDGYTALMTAAANLESRAARLLLAAGARPEDLNHEGENVLHLVGAFTSPEEDEEAEEQRQRKTLLMAKLFIEAGADINAQDMTGFSPLMVAAREGYGRVAALLVEKSADIGLKNNEGWTALEIAQAEGRVDIAAMIQKVMDTAIAEKRAAQRAVSARKQATLRDITRRKGGPLP